jgi:DNA-directed RNA polymerase subunit RPC12/RpoP
LEGIGEGDMNNWGSVCTDRFTGSNDEPYRCASCGREVSETLVYDMFNGGDVDESLIECEECAQIPENVRARYE